MEDKLAIDKKIMNGYELLNKKKTAEACDVWLEAWDSMKKLIAENHVNNIVEINKLYEWTEYPSNYVQELEAELHNAGIGNPDYYRKRIIYCNELLEYTGDETLMKENTRRAIADSYFELGDTVECDRLYDKWLSDDPQWGWGYIGWFRCYEGTWHGRQDIKKATEIMERALCVTDIRDRLDVVDAALDIYEDDGAGGSARISALRAEVAELNSQRLPRWATRKPLPAAVIKAGRNDPCPCGSGKKYKKCHGKADI